MSIRARVSIKKGEGQYQLGRGSVSIRASIRSTGHGHIHALGAGVEVDSVAHLEGEDGRLGAVGLPQHGGRREVREQELRVGHQRRQRARQLFVAHQAIQKLPPG